VVTTTVEQRKPKKAQRRLPEKRKGNPEKRKDPKRRIIQNITSRSRSRAATNEEKLKFENPIGKETLENPERRKRERPLRSADTQPGSSWVCDITPYPTLMGRE
jgi:hypothetical protein